MEGNPLKIKAIREALPERYADIRLTDDDFVDALYSLLFDTDAPVITIMGAGGTGKSFMYKVYCSIRRVLCTATTGIAAFNLSQDGIPAMTLHSALKLKPHPWFDSRSASSINEMMDNYNELFIDEVSMLNANLLDFILTKIRGVNEGRKKSGKPIFRVVLFGDTLQLPPVVKEYERNIRVLWQKEYGGEHMFYNSKAFREYREQGASRFFFLDEIHRQDRKEFMNILNEIRFAVPSSDTLEKINSHVINIDDFTRNQGKDGFLYLATKNKTVKAVNDEFEKVFREQGMTPVVYEAEETGDPDWKHYFTNMEKKVELYVGQQVMCISNDVNKHYQNGTLGIIVGFMPFMNPFPDETELSEFKKELVELNRGFVLPVIQTKIGTFQVMRSKFEEYTIKYYNDTDGTYSIPEVKGAITQISCKPAYACTIHKSQGLTLSAVYLDTTDSPMENGVYVALSRLKSLDGLGLKVPIEKTDIRTNEESIKLYREFNALVGD